MVKSFMFQNTHDRWRGRQRGDLVYNMTYHDLGNSMLKCINGWWLKTKSNALKCIYHPTHTCKKDLLLN